MTKKKNNICHLLGNRLSLFCVFSFAVLVLIGYKWYRKEHSYVYKKLQGTYEMVLDSTSIFRSFDVIPLDLNVKISKDDISLPLFDCVHSSIHDVNNYHDIDRIYSKKNGCWKIVSSMPDSIFIDADAHVLHGKYQVKFRTYQTGSLGYTSDSYLYLDNDSTHLCLRKLE